MKDEEWFAKWEEDLPSPDELMPLTQNLITPDLAAAFKIHSPPESLSVFPHQTQHNHQPQHNHRPEVSKRLGEAEEEESSVGGGGGSGGAGGGGGGGGEEPARTLKRPRLVWTPQLHKRFVDAVAHLGIKNAVPKTIMQLMNVEGLTRENVASHLQKYRLYLKRMQGLSSEGPSSCDHLFASTPVPPSHFLHRDDMMLPLVSMPHMPSAPHYATFDPRFLSGLPRQPPPPAPPPQRMAMAPSPSASGFTRGEYVMVDDLSTVSSVGPPRQVLTLFPNSDN